MGIGLLTWPGIFTYALPTRYRQWRPIQGTAFAGDAILSGIVQPALDSWIYGEPLSTGMFLKSLVT
jgi:hypothetical protein